MRKELYIYKDGKPLKMTIRRYGTSDFRQMIAIQQESFPPPFPAELWWNEEQLSEHVARFPEGAICAEAEGRLIGSMTGLLVDGSTLAGAHSWEAVTDNGYIRSHDPDGDTLYVVDISVIPAFRKSGVGKWLMQTMYETVVHLGLRRLLGGGRMPNYHLHKSEATPEQYVRKVLEGEWRDPVIGFLLRCGRVPVGIAEGYLEDEESGHCAAIMEWRNPFFEERQEER